MWVQDCVYAWMDLCAVFITSPLMPLQLITEDEEQQQERDNRCPASLASSRAISCSDVLLLDYTSSIGSDTHRICEEVDEEEENTMTPLSRARSPSMTSQDSGLAVAQYSNRASVHSTASSTSGFESQGFPTDDSTNLEPSSPSSSVAPSTIPFRRKSNPLSSALRMLRRVYSSKGLG